MASGGRPKTTRGKLQREAVLRERRSEKAARKQVRKQALLDPGVPDELDPGVPEIDMDPSVAQPESPASL